VSGVVNRSFRNAETKPPKNDLLYMAHRCSGALPKREKNEKNLKFFWGGVLLGGKRYIWGRWVNGYTR